MFSNTRELQSVRKGRNNNFRTPTCLEVGHVWGLGPPDSPNKSDTEVGLYSMVVYTFLNLATLHQQLTKETGVLLPPVVEQSIGSNIVKFTKIDGDPLHPGQY